MEEVRQPYNPVTPTLPEKRKQGSDANPEEKKPGKWKWSDIIRVNCTDVRLLRKILLQNLKAKYN